MAYENGNASSIQGIGVDNTPPVNGEALIFNSTSGEYEPGPAGGGGGDVAGPASSTDNAIARFDLTTGKLIQNSGVTISDFNALTTPSSVTAGKLVGSLSDSGTSLTAGFPNQELINTDGTANNWIRTFYTDTAGGSPAAITGVQVTDHTNEYGDYIVATRSAGTGLTEKLRIGGDGNINAQAGNITTTGNMSCAVRLTTGTSVASAGVRWSGSNGTSLGLMRNVPTGGTHSFAIANTSLLDISAGVIDAQANNITTTGAISGGNLSGTNTGDQTSIVGITGTKAQFNTALSDGSFATGGGTATGTNTGDQTTVTGNSGTTNALISATTTVNVSSATAPTTGQVLTATSGTAATWQNAGGGGAFATASNVTSNSPGTLATDDFVFGSDQLDDDTDSTHDARFLFDKSQSAFRAGKAFGTDWDTANRGLYSFGLGVNGVASGDASGTFGQNNTASAGRSYAFGTSVVNSGENSLAVGISYTNTQADSISIGDIGSVIRLEADADQNNTRKASVFITQTTAPTTTTDRLYNVGGALTWNGVALGAVATKEVCAVSLTANQNFTTSLATLLLSTESIDTGSDFNTGTYAYTVPTTGNYFVSIRCSYNSVVAGDTLDINLVKGGVGSFYSFGSKAHSDTGVISSNLCTPLTAGEVLTLQIRNQTSARGALSAFGGTTMSILQL